MYGIEPRPFESLKNLAVMCHVKLWTTLKDSCTQELGLWGQYCNLDVNNAERSQTLQSCLCGNGNPCSEIPDGSGTRARDLYYSLCCDSVTPRCSAVPVCTYNFDFSKLQLAKVSPVSQDEHSPGISGANSNRPNINTKILTVGKWLYTSTIALANQDQDSVSKLIKYEKLV